MTNPIYVPKVHLNCELIVPSSSISIERMVHVDRLRKEFAERLKGAAKDASIPEWGLGARLAEITKTTPKAASKWINAETMPGRANMLVIAKALGVRPEWLQYAELPKEAASSTADAPPSNKPPQAAALDGYAKIIYEELLALKSPDPDRLRIALGILNGTITPSSVNGAPTAPTQADLSQLLLKNVIDPDTDLAAYFGAKTEEERKEIQIEIGGRVIKMLDRREHNALPPGQKNRRAEGKH
jgi:hypothetical protein